MSLIHFKSRNGGIVNSFKTGVITLGLKFFAVGKGGGVFKGIIGLFDDVKSCIARRNKSNKNFFTV